MDDLHRHARDNNVETKDLYGCHYTIFQGLGNTEQRNLCYRVRNFRQIAGVGVRVQCGGSDVESKKGPYHYEPYFTALSVPAT